MKNHLRCTHNYGVPSISFLCPICSKPFKLKYEMNRHVKHHKGIMPKCHLCGEMFRRPKLLREHLLVAHAVVEHCSSLMLSTNIVEDLDMTVEVDKTDTMNPGYH